MLSRSKVNAVIAVCQKAAVVAVVGTALLNVACSSPPRAQPARTFPGPESYLTGKNIEVVARVYGNPSKSNSVGNTTFISYSGSGRSGSGYSNICFLEIQADRENGIIRQVSMGSNLGIDSQRFGFDVGQDCNRIFYREKLVQ